MPPPPDDSFPPVTREIAAIDAVFDAAHYASTPWQKLKRSLQLAPRYYLWDIPRYLLHRRANGLSIWDWESLWNPLRELRALPATEMALPEQYDDALRAILAAGIRLTLPRTRIDGLSAAWGTTQNVPGDVIECGAYRGATSLLLAELGRRHGVPQTVLILDTFSGIDGASARDVSRTGHEYIPPPDQVATIHRQADSLGVSNRIEIHRGSFRETFAKASVRARQLAFVHVDANLYEGTLQACEFALPRMSRGGVIVFDDYYGVCDLGARLAIDTALAPRGLRPTPLAGYSAVLKFSE